MKKGLYYGWAIVVALGVTTCISYGTNQYLFGLLVDPVSRELGWEKGALAVAYSGLLLCSALTGLVLGPALDRIGARPLLASGSLITGLALIALARVHSLLAFDLLWTFAIGIGSALTFYPVTMTVVANWFDRQRTRALSALTFMGAFSSTLTYPIAGALIARFGWREALVMLGAAHLLVALPLHVLIVRRHPEDHGLYPDGAAAPGQSTPQSGVTLAAALRSAAFWLPTIAIALAYFASTAVLLEHVAYLIARGYAPVFAATVLGLFGIAYLPGRWFIAWSGDRFSLTLLFCAAFAIEALGIIVLMRAPSLPGLIVYVCTFGAAYGATFPLRGSLMAQRFGRRAYGAILAAQGLPVRIVSALGPLVAGRLIDTLGYGAGFTACAAALAAAAVIMVLPVSQPRGLAGLPAYREYTGVPEETVG